LAVAQSLTCVANVEDVARGVRVGAERKRVSKGRPLTEFLKFQVKGNQFVAQQVELHMHYLKKDPHSREIAFDKEKAVPEALQARFDTIASENQDI
jgi:hypothetical protein